jgi:hypothetical protein
MGGCGDYGRLCREATDGDVVNVRFSQFCQMRGGNDSLERGWWCCRVVRAAFNYLAGEDVC